MDRNGGGDAVLIKNGIRYQVFKNFVNCPLGLECCAVELMFDNQKLIIISCYRPSNRSITENEWINFFDQFNNINVLIGGDFNAHHCAWGSKNISLEGRNLFDVVLQSDLTCINNGSITRENFVGGNGSIIDLTFCSPGIVPAL